MQAELLRAAPCLQAAVLNAMGKNPTGKVRPSVMAFSRQGMPNQPGTSKEGTVKGGYIVHGGDAKPDVIFLASGARMRLLWALKSHGLDQEAACPRANADVPYVSSFVGGALQTCRTLVREMFEAWVSCCVRLGAQPGD
jgi:transketolase